MDLVKATENLTLAKQDKKPIEITEFNNSRALGALKDKLIEDCTEEEVKVKLVLIYSMVGLRAHHYPIGQEKQDLHDYIRLKYGKKTLSELILAFDLAINNELEIDPKEVKVYDQFPIAYLAQIMAAYKIWLSKQSKKTIMAQQQPETELEPIDMIDWIEEYRKQENINRELIPLCFYDFLSETILPVNKEMKWEYWQKAKESIKSELLAAIPDDKTNNSLNAWKEFEKCEREKKWDDVMFSRISNRAKRMIVYEYLTKK